MWKKVTDIADADEIHMVYNSYLENSPKGHERLKRTAEAEPISFVNLSRQSYKVSPESSLLRCPKSVGSQWSLVVVLLRLITYETLKCFTKMQIHSNLN